MVFEREASGRHSGIVNTVSQIFAGVKTFLLSPKVPTPTEGDDAVNKDYVDDSGSIGVLSVYNAGDQVAPSSEGGISFSGEGKKIGEVTHSTVSLSNEITMDAVGTVQVAFSASIEVT